MSTRVKVWEEVVLLPTYGTGKPEKNPMFLEKRVYQGSSGAVYPYPVIEKINDTCEDKAYHAVYLENEYIKVMVLPELGGRIQMAYDKLKERHFIYYNHVIKPALVGLTGPWISGGIEFNWPQHHRPSTFLPVDYSLEECADGSAIVWVSERERMTHQKGMAGFKLSPGRAVLEIQGTLYNPTPLPQTFLWWANPAVAVNEHYQSVFPGDVHAVFDHGKRDVSSYPVATGTYYKVDYSKGVDISRYKNIPVPTSYMAIHSDYDFVGGYENDTQAGVLHVANHHLSPGKKQWTWGNSDFGQAWDRNLTDTDGPYIELMAGVFTDNQPDFSWIQPYEEKTFTQYFIPYRELGVVKAASADILMNFAEGEKGFQLRLLGTSELKQVAISVCKGDAILFDCYADLSPEAIYEVPCFLTDLAGIEVFAWKSHKRLLHWKHEPEKAQPMPEPAKPALEPAEVSSTEQLYLTGLHLEQYRHATYLPTGYYLEALRRDPSDVRNNNAMGLWILRRGQFAKAEPYFRKAIQTLTQRNPNPYDGEPCYNLGLSLKFQGKPDEAYDAFYKACWNAAWQEAGYFSLAQISTEWQMYGEALSEVDKSLARNRHNLRACHLKASLLRKLERKEEALALIHDSLEADRFNMGCRFEFYLLSNREKDLEDFKHCMGKDSHNYAELALDYAASGCYEEALAVLDCTPYPGRMIGYYKAWCCHLQRNDTKATAIIRDAEEKEPEFCFPNRLEAIQALQTAVSLVKYTPKASYLLGNIWYDKRQYDEAIAAWERSAAQDSSFPTVWRNLSLAYFNKLGKKQEALEWMEKAFRLDPSDARILMELDQLYKRLNRPYTERLAFLEQHKETAWKRDDIYLEYVTLLNQSGQHGEAIRLIGARKFHPWEGGEGKVPAQYQLARVSLAKRHLAGKNYEEVLRLIEECYLYPHNLGEGKLYGAQENDFDYYKGCALEGLGREEEAKACFEKASKGNYTLAAAMYYNDQKPDKIFYQGLALLKLGRTEEAKSRFQNLITYGEKHLSDTFKMDYFAVSLPDLQIWEDDMDKKNRTHCEYLIELGHLGLGDIEKTKQLTNGKT
ncbi:hypothetical protein FACS1894181_01090 [Bacteroidia bacterium]|nr:hypothetical protein FACS1894181_01090 [Bacteroidia bacterium]